MKNKLNDLRGLASVLVCFEAYYYPNSSLVYFNNKDYSDLASDKLISEYSFTTTFKKTYPKMFSAEIYGGKGMAFNGGGGRCGFDGKYQVKGMGANCLVGQSASSSYSDGMLPLHDAVHETIWGEVVNLIFPHGAVRAIAIISLSDDGPHLENSYRRGLLIREAVVRPAHFERSIYFRPKHEFKEILADYVERSIESIRCIVDFLPRPDFMDVDFPWDTLTNEKKFRFGIVELSKRFAENLAFSAAKNIYHGALSASNISIDGKWLDFGSITTLPMENFFEKNQPNFLTTQHLSFFDHIDNMCFYAGKYLEGDVCFYGETIHIAKSAFHEYYANASRIFELEEIGFPCKALEAYPEIWPLVEILYNSIQAIKKNGILSLPCSEPIIAGMANKILQTALCTSLNELFTQNFSLESQNSEAKKIAQFNVDYMRLVDSVCAVTHLNKSNFLFGSIISILRHSRRCDYLRDISEIKQKILVCDASAEKQVAIFSNALNLLVARVRATQTVITDFDILCWKNENSILSYNLYSGQFSESFENSGELMALSWEELVSVNGITSQSFIEILGRDSVTFINEKI